MAPRRTPDDEDDPSLSFLEAMDDDSPAPPPGDAFSAQNFVNALFQQPLFGAATDPADVLDLRRAGRAKLQSAGFFGNAFTALPATPPAGPPSSDAFEQRGPPSWKLPARTRSIPQTVLGDDTAIGAGRLPAEIGRTGADDDAAAAAPPAPRFDNDPTAMRNAPPAAPTAETPSEPNAAAPLDHPEARTGLALVAADTLLRRGAEVLAQVAGGNRAVVKQALDAAVAWIGSALPPEYQASAAKSGEAALADAQRRMDENDASTRNRAAIGTLANRRAEAEREHVEALIGNDPAKLVEARRDVIDAWRAERVARGDSPSEINAGARTFEARLRETALRHRLAQLDDAGLDRAAEEDVDAKADPASARRIADEIRRIRREDPARAGEASVEREIERRKRDGRIDTPDEETRARYALRLEAQARRGIPEDKRRLLTNEERTRIVAEAERITDPAKRARFIDTTAGDAGPYAARLKDELAPTPRQYAEAPGTTSNVAPPHPEIGGAKNADRNEERGESEKADTDISKNRIRPEDRRQPEPSSSSDPLGADFGVPLPTSPLRELRRVIGRIRAVAALKDDGTPVMSDQQVGAYLDEARKHIRPEYQDSFEITVLAVRAGMIPSWRAAERLREYYAPETTGEAILDGVLDFIPIVGQVKGAIEIGDALDSLRIALDEGDEAGAAKFAGEAAFLIAGLVPVLKAGKFAKHIPGIEKLKGILGEFAGGRLPFHEFLEKWNKNWKLEGHHSFPLFLGGIKKEGIARLRASVHRNLHRDLNAFLHGIANMEGKHMRPLPGNSGARIKENFNLQERIRAMADFYNGPGNRLRYRNARREFFRLFPELAP